MISWSAPDDGGTQISAFEIYIQHAVEGVFTKELVNCDGSKLEIILSRSCLIPNTVLNIDPYNLDWGSNVIARITAINIYGTSPIS